MGPLGLHFPLVAPLRVSRVPLGLSGLHLGLVQLISVPSVPWEVSSCPPGFQLRTFRVPFGPPSCFESRDDRDILKLSALSVSSPGLRDPSDLHTSTPSLGPTFFRYHSRRLWVLSREGDHSAAGKRNRPRGGGCVHVPRGNRFCTRGAAACNAIEAASSRCHA